MLTGSFQEDVYSNFCKKFIASLEYRYYIYINIHI